MNLASYKFWVDYIFDVNLSISTLSNMFCKDLGYSVKKPNQTNNILKFTIENIQYTLHFMGWLSSVDIKLIKFLDEVHFDGRGTKVRWVRGKINERVTNVNYLNLNETLSITLMCSSNGLSSPIFYTSRKTSNDQFDFLQFIIEAVEFGFLKSGDYLCYDNATIHFGENIIEILHLILTATGVRVILLPTFSPEFNPCEFIFSWIKNKIYHYGLLHCTLDQNIQLVANQLQFEQIKGWYKKCCVNILI